MVDIEKTLSSLVRRTRRKRADRLVQLLERERLGKHRVRHAGERLRADRSRQHRHGQPRVVAAQLVQKVQSAARPDVDVEQGDVDSAVRKRVSSLVESPGVPHRPTVELEVDTAEKADRGVVVDDENGVAGRIHAVGECTRNPRSAWDVYSLKMTNRPTQSEESSERDAGRIRARLPSATPQFRQRCWLAFQRALDPLAPPRALRSRKR